MAGKKNNGVVAVISDLTNEQAAQLTKEIIKAKRKIAPKGKSILQNVQEGCDKIYKNKKEEKQ